MFNEQHLYGRFNRRSQYGAEYGNAIVKMKPRHRHNKKMWALTVCILIATVIVGCWGR